VAPLHVSIKHSICDTGRYVDLMGGEGTNTDGGPSRIKKEEEDEEEAADYSWFHCRNNKVFYTKIITSSDP
jgi:hypothetical protein